MISCFKGKFKVTSPRGYRTHPVTGEKGTFHKGIDLVGIQDTIVYSISEGVATTAYQANGAGYYVVVTMDDGRRVFYMHLAKDSFKVINGQRVSRGQALGVMGSTGNSTGAHTHLELRPAGTTYDSLDITEFTGIPNKIGTYEYKEENDMKFKDVPETHWAFKDIEEFAEMGIVNGFEDGTFKPDKSMTRAEACAFGNRLMKKIIELRKA